MELLNKQIWGQALACLHEKYLSQYFTVEILTDGDFCISIYNDVLSVIEDNTSDIYYSKNNGLSWNLIPKYTIYAENGEVLDETYKLSCTVGDKIMFKHDFAQYQQFTNTYLYIETRIGNVLYTELEEQLTFSEFNCYGNIMSLFYGDNFLNQYKFPNLGTCSYMFYNSLVKDASNLILPAIDLSSTKYAYANMFELSSLTKAPKIIPAILNENCYEYMFSGCNNLSGTITVPKPLNSYKNDNAYSYMFSEINNPDLHVEFLATMHKDILKSVLSHVGSDHLNIYNLIERTILSIEVVLPWEEVNGEIGSNGYSYHYIYNLFNIDATNVSARLENMIEGPNTTKVKNEAKQDVINKCSKYVNRWQYTENGALDPDENGNPILTGDNNLIYAPDTFGSIMKFIHDFDDYNENTYIKNDLTDLKNIIYKIITNRNIDNSIPPGLEVKVTEPLQYFIKKPLTFETIDVCTFKLYREKDILETDIEYTLDNGKNWLAYNTPIQVPANTIISWRTTTEKNTSGRFALIIDNYVDISGKYKTTGMFNAYGNIMSLITPNYENADTIPDDDCFKGCLAYTEIINAENLVLPAIHLTSGCYDSMFFHCEKLIYPVAVLPCKRIAGLNGCYRDMFGYCSNMITTPALLMANNGCTEYPNNGATVNLCHFMFMNCYSICTPQKIYTKYSITDSNHQNYAGMYSDTYLIPSISVYAHSWPNRHGTTNGFYGYGGDFSISTFGQEILEYNADVYGYLTHPDGSTNLDLGKIQAPGGAGKLGDFKNCYDLTTGNKLNDDIEYFIYLQVLNETIEEYDYIKFNIDLKDNWYNILYKILNSTNYLNNFNISIKHTNKGDIILLEKNNSLYTLYNTAEAAKTDIIYINKNILVPFINGGLNANEEFFNQTYYIREYNP